MKKHLGNVIKLVISLGIGVGLVYWFIGQMSESDKLHVIEDIKRANYFWVALPPIIGLISNYFRSERWRLLLNSMGYNPGFWNTFLSVMLMYFLNIFFPRLGEVTRCGVLARYEKIPLDKAIGTMVLERLLDVLCLGIVVLVLIFAEHDKFFMLYEQIQHKIQNELAGTIAKNQINPILKYGVTIGAFLALIIFIGVQIRAKGFDNIMATVKDRIMGLVRGIISVKDVKNPFTLLFHTVMIWGCYLIMPYVGFRMFPETAELSLMTAGVCLFFSGVAFSLTPGGLGLFPIFMGIVLGLYQVVGSAAISWGLVSWTAQTASVMIGGVISLIALAIINRDPALEEGEPLKA